KRDWSSDVCSSDLFSRDARSHRTVVAIDPPVGKQVQIPVEQASVETFQWQSLSAALTNDPQKGFGALHFAYLTIVEDLLTPGGLRPVDGFPVLLGRA